ncbi:MAG: hypothetical protein SF028_00190 [Candidatus Sumerlaeia bacterium]|nr:hypothetical protein [Candidatus Sumerlaeia bacterium]
MTRAATLALLLLAATAPADVIHRKVGPPIQGYILSRSDGKVRVRSGGSIIQLRESDIVRIDAAEDAGAGLAELEAQLRGGDPVRAVEAATLRLRGGGDAEELSRLFLRNSFRLMERATALAGNDAIAYRLALRDLAAEDPLPDELRLFIAQVLFQSGDIEHAAAQVRRIAPGWFEGRPIDRDWARRVLLDEVRRLAQSARFGEAIELASGLDEIVDAGAFRARPLALLAQAADARDSGRADEAMRLLTGELADAVPEVARNRAALLLASLRTTADRDGTHADARAVAALARDRFPTDAEEAELDLFAREVRWYLDRNDVEGAWYTVNAVELGRRTPELAELAVRVEYLRREAETDRGNPLALFELALWCAANGLLEEAEPLFLESTKNETMRELAVAQLVLVRDAQDTARLEHALERYDAGDLREAGRLAALILAREGRRSAVAREAERLAKLSEDGLETEEKRRPYLAEVEYQQAERAYYLAEFSGALEHLRTILRNYEDTPAAERAKELLPAVRQQIELAYLEGRLRDLPRLDFAVSGEAIGSASRLREEIDALLAPFADAASRRALSRGNP